MIRAKGWHPVPIFIGLCGVAVVICFVLLWSKFPEPIQMVWPVPDNGELSSWKDIIEANNNYKASISAQRGQLGDMLGGIFNPLLAFCSTIGLILTVMLSIEQLNRARLATLAERKRARIDARRAATDSLRSKEAALASDSLVALTALLQHAREASIHARKFPNIYPLSHANSLEKDADEIANLLERSFVNARTQLQGQSFLPERMSSRHDGREQEDALA